ncbi:MAG: PfkB family carbohydrate kinase, partial [Hyphomicrobiaceae bacterium]
PDRATAEFAFGEALTRADIVLASVEDLKLLFDHADIERLLVYQVEAELVLKLDHPACRLLYNGCDELVTAEPVAHVIDTTAAGDSFAAAYLAARLQGKDPVAAARAGHRLAGAVVQHRGAIVPRAAMPDMHV